MILHEPKIKKPKSLVLFCTTILLANACSNVSTNDLNNKSVKLAATSSVSGNSFLDQGEIACPKESEFGIKAEKDDNFSPIKPEERGKGVESTSIPNSEDSGFGWYDPKKKYKHPYAVNYNVPDDVKTGDISIDFKDEYKVRFKDVRSDEDKNLKINEEEKGDKYNFGLVSESGEKELREIEKIFIEYKASNLNGLAYTSDADERELRGEKDCECDYPNMLSHYSFNIEDQNMKEMIEKLRLNPMVRQVNYSPRGETADARSEAIFSNGSNITGTDVVGNTLPAITESSRYNHLKTNMYKAYGIVESDIVNDTSIIVPNIAVIDSGYINAHQDRPAYHSSSTPYVTCTSTGCTTSSNPATVEYNPLVSGSEHGTWVSSVIASPENNGGVVGYSHKSKIIPIVASGLTQESVANAIDYVRLNKISLNAKVINISLQFRVDGNNWQSPEAVEVIKTAIDNAVQNGILVVMCAGNYSNKLKDNSDVGSFISKGLVVGGVAKYTNNRAIYSSTQASNYGKRVDISAPAERIIVPSRQGNNKYTEVNGTSFAAPQVAAVGALLMSLPTRPDLNLWTEESVEKVKSLLVNTASLIQADKPIGSLSNANHIPNGRMLDAYNALNTARSMQSGKSYVRLFNIDQYSEVLFNSPNNTTFPLHTFYKEDKFLEIPKTTTNRIDFSTYNIGCTYSWGYQIWKDSQITFQRVKGIAGKRKPLKLNGSIANNVDNAILTENNTGIGYASPTDYQGPDLWTSQTNLWN